MKDRSWMLALFLAPVGLFCAVKALIGFLGDHRTPAAILTPVGVVVGIFVLIVLYQLRGTSGGSSFRTVHGHTADWNTAARHEAGHAAVARSVGGSVTGARISANGAGWTSYRPDQWMTPAEEIAIALGGAYAEGVSIGTPQCRGDNAHIQRVLRHCGSRGRVMAKAERLARQGLARQRSYAGRVERQLKSRGRL